MRGLLAIQIEPKILFYCVLKPIPGSACIIYMQQFVLAYSYNKLIHAEILDFEANRVPVDVYRSKIRGFLKTSRP